MRCRLHSLRRLGPGLVLSAGLLTAQSQTNTPEARKISLDECIQIALAHNLDVQIQRVRPEISRFSLDASYGAYDPRFSASGSYSYSQSAGGIDPQGRIYSGTETTVEQATVGLSGMLPWGTTYGIGANYSGTWGSSPTVVPDYSRPIVITNTFLNLQDHQPVSYLTTNYNYISSRQSFAVFSGQAGVLSFAQPLLRNFWINDSRLQIFLNKKNLQTSELVFRSQVMNTVFAVEQAYFNLVYAMENVKVQRKAVELAERTVFENKKRVEIGTLAPLDAKQAESQAASGRAALLAALDALGLQGRLLKSLLSDDYALWRNVSLEPSGILVAVPESLDLQESWRLGLTLRPDILQQKINLQRQGYIVRYDKNQLFPELDLIGNYSYSASGSDFSGMLDQFRARENPTWMVGGQMSIPLSQTTARNTYKADKATRRQFALQLKQIQQNAMINIENDVSAAKTAFQRVGATHEATLFAQAALDAEQKKLESGQSTSFTVLQLQRNLTDAGSIESRALADYNIALAQLYLDQGTILERRHVNLHLK